MLPACLAQATIASAVSAVIVEGESQGEYELGSWVLMPDHAHLTMRPSADLGQAIRKVKGRTARFSNQILARTGTFWQKDYFDRLIRDRDEEANITRYIEWNPVKAGLCAEPEEWPWGSCGYRAKRD